ncbi:MAG: TolC family protein [Acidobacteria bacterium]|nr:TolC family protein [Acidobacteriota bacterium]
MTLIRSQSVVTAFACFAVTLVNGAAAAAQTPTHPPTPVARVRAGAPMSIGALVERALTTAPTVRAAWSRVESAKGDMTQAAARANPEVMTERRDAFDGMNSQTAVGVTWPLELGRRSARAAVAVDGIAKAALLATEAERQVAARVKLAAIRALAADRLLAIATETVEAHQQWCDLIEARVAEGAAAPIDRDVAEVELRQGLAMLTRLRAESAARWAELNAAAGFDSTASFTLSETLEQAVAEVRKSPPALMADALDARADVAAAQAAVEIAEAKTSLARRAGGLDLSLNATYMRTASGFPQMFMTPTGGMASPENRMNEFVIGATIMWPWRNRNAGMVAAATAEARTAEFERDALLQSAQAETSAAEIRDIEAGRGLEIYSNGLLTLAAKNRDVITESYAFGRVTRFEVITEGRRFRELQEAYVAALIEAF